LQKLALMIRDGFRDRGALGTILGGPSRCELCELVTCLQSLKVFPSCVVPPQKSSVCGADFGSMTAIDL